MSARKAPDLKVVCGSRKPEPETTDEPSAEDVLAELPPAPDYLPNDEAKSEWKRTGRLLIERGWLTEMRLSALGLFCAMHGKLTQVLHAGDLPKAHLLQQYRQMQRDLGIIGMTNKTQVDDKPKPGKWNGLKERADREA
jgi:phage terminase small subunit